MEIHQDCRQNFAPLFVRKFSLRASVVLFSLHNWELLLSRVQICPDNPNRQIQFWYGFGRGIAVCEALREVHQYTDCSSWNWQEKADTADAWCYETGWFSWTEHISTHFVHWNCPWVPGSSHNLTLLPLGTPGDIPRCYSINSCWTAADSLR